MHRNSFCTSGIDWPIKYKLQHMYVVLMDRARNVPTRSGHKFRFTSWLASGEIFYDAEDTSFFRLSSQDGQPFSQEIKPQELQATLVVFPRGVRGHECCCQSQPFSAEFRRQTNNTSHRHSWQCASTGRRQRYRYCWPTRWSPCSKPPSFDKYVTLTSPRDGLSSTTNSSSLSKHTMTVF
jgi:hypothetical protein